MIPSNECKDREANLASIQRSYKAFQGLLSLIGICTLQTTPVNNPSRHGEDQESSSSQHKKVKKSQHCCQLARHVQAGPKIRILQEFIGPLPKSHKALFLIKHLSATHDRLLAAILQGPKFDYQQFDPDISLPPYVPPEGDAPGAQEEEEEDFQARLLRQAEEDEDYAEGDAEDGDEDEDAD